MGHNVSNKYVNILLKVLAAPSFIFDPAITGSKMKENEEIIEEINEEITLNVRMALHITFVCAAGVHSTKISSCKKSAWF